MFAEINSLFADYELFKESSLKERRFKHDDVKKLLDKLRDIFEINEIGKSVESRSINLIKIGGGKTKIILWSQMHGDEATATMAIFDLLNFFNTNDSNYQKSVEYLKDKLTLYFIPILNPDGAEVFTRRNAVGIDLNRDALKLASEEAKVFKGIIDELKPDFAFNLHDQNPRYSVGETTKPATISFLAPPFDYSRAENETRTKAMQVIVFLEKMLQEYIPGQVAKFTDEFEPRAFGDNIQRWGTSTILVESGGYPNDTENQFIRKLNFLLLIYAFQAIATEQFRQESIEDYHKVPINSKNIYDLIIRNAIVVIHGKEYKTDIGINRYEITDGRGFYYKSKIEEIGDMSIYAGFEEFDAEGMVVEQGLSFTTDLPMAMIEESLALTSLKRGITTLCVGDNITEEKPVYLPINFSNKESSSTKINIDNNADLIFRRKDIVCFATVNGFLVDLINNKVPEMNGLMLR